MIAIDTGRRWAYAGVVLGFTASITANVANTVLSGHTVPLALRIPFAVVWPLFTYVAIEVIVRTNWSKSLTHTMIKLVLWVPVAGVGAYVSYLHQHHLMVMAGEPGMAQLFGPLAVDGMLFGMTARLIATRQRTSLAELTPELQELALAAPVSPAPRRERAPRGRWDVAKVCEMAVDGARPSEAAGATGIGESTFARYLRVARALQAAPLADINFDAKVPSEHIAMMRKMVTR